MPPRLRLNDRIAVANSPSDVASINRMIGDLVQALRTKGYDPYVFDPQYPANWAGLASKGINTLICYGGGIDGAAQMAPMLKGINTLMVSLDHPTYWMIEFSQFRAEHMGKAAFTFPSHSNIAFAQRILGNVPIHCLRHSAKSVETVPMNQRTGAIILVGNYMPEDEIATAIDRRPPDLRTIYDKALDDLKTRRVPSLEESLSRYFADPYGANREPFTWMCGMVDRTLRSRARRAALESLAGHKVEVIGRGWETLDLPDSVTLLGETDAALVVERFGNAKIIVNTMPYYVESHERLYEAAAHGCALVTADNAYNRARFAQCGAFYQNETEIGDLCAALLADPSALAAQSQAGVQLIRDRDGWDHRSGEILDLLNHVDDAPPQSLHRRYDLILDIQSANGKLDLSIEQLSQSSDILIRISPDQMNIALQIFAQARQYFPSHAMISMVTDRSVPNGFFNQAAEVLAQNGYQPLEANHAPSYAGMTARKG